MCDIIYKFNIFVSASRSETFPRVLLEAMAAGCPIVATNVGGNSSVVKHGVNGSLVQEKNPNLLSSEIVKILSDNELRKKYILNSLDLFNTQFSAEIMTRNYEKLYQKI